MSHTAILQPDRRVPTGARRAVISSGIRHLARKMEASHPALGTPGHLRDAARELDRGNTEGAQRHLRAGLNDLQPVNLYRHGITDDQGHTGARQHLTSIHRHLLNVRDVEDTMNRAPLPGGGPSFSPSAIEGEAVTPGYKAGNQAMNAPAKPPIGRSDRAAEGPRAPSTPSSKQQSYSRPSGHILNLSAQTARLAVTPAPRGKPGGPGLYDVKGNEHSPYFQQVVKALIEKRGMPPGKAYAIAWGALRRWRAGKGNVHPEVRAAAAGSLAQEDAARARAHAHSWADVETAIELATYDFGGPGSGNPNQARVPAGQAGGGRFTAGGGSASKHPPGHPARMHHVAKHPAASMNHAQRSHAKAALLAKAHQLTLKADAIAAQIAALRAQLRSAAGTGRSAAAGAGKAAAAAATKAAAAATTAAAAGKAGTAASTRASTSSRSTSQISARITQLRTQEHALRVQAHTLRAQASKL